MFCLLHCLNHIAFGHALDTIGKPSMSRVHPGGPTTFWSTMKKWLNIEHWTFNKTRTKILTEIGQILGIIEKCQWVGFNRDDFIIFRLKLWEILKFE
jgi:hypothetical protein